MANTQNSSSIISQIYTSRKTLIELLKAQNYNTDEYEGFSVNEINTMRENKQLDMILLENNNEITSQEEDTRKKIYISYYFGTLRPADLNEMIEDLFHVEEVLKAHRDTLFIVTKNDMNDTLQNAVKHIWEQERIFVIVQSLKRLQFNIMEHYLVPKHRILTTQETNVIREKYNISNDGQIPALSRFDPVAQVIFMKPGDVCEIIRPSKTAISSKYYRACVN